MKTWLFCSLLTLVFWSIWSPLMNYSIQAVGNPFRVLILESLGFLVVIVPLPLLVSFRAQTPSFKADVLAFGAGLFAALGTLTIIYAFKGGGRPEIVTPLVSLIPALTVLWMWWFFEARLNYMQGLGVFLAIIAAFILARSSP